MNDPKVWTKEGCKRILEKERVTSGKTREEFWRKVLTWHHKQYTDAGFDAQNNPGVSVLWADRCLEVLEETEKEMGLWAPLKDMPPPPEPPKKSVFAKLKEKQG